MNKRQLTRFAIFSFALMLSACRQPNRVINTAVPSPTPLPSISTTQSITTATSSTTNTASLPPGSTPLLLPDVPETLNEMEDWLVTHWQQQSNPDIVLNTLKQSGWLHYHVPLPVPNGANVETPGWNVLDLDGNNSNEWVVSLRVCSDQEWHRWGSDPECDSNTIFGDLWVINENGIVYRTYPTLEELGEAPVSIIQADMTGDNLPELVTVASHCSANTCFPTFRIITGHFGTIQNAIRTPLSEQNNTYVDSIRMLESVAYAENQTNDPIADLRLFGGAFGSTGAGPQRRETQIWSWDGQRISLYAIEYEPVGYVVHALYQANDYYDDHQFRLADSWYQRVLQDQSLREWISTGEERLMSQQFAGFRLVLLHLQRDDFAEAIYWQGWLLDRFPESPFTEAATLLLAKWETVDNPEQACEVVTTLLIEKDAERTAELTDCRYGDGQVCGLLYPIEVMGNYGMNPYLYARDLCVMSDP